MHMDDDQVLTMDPFILLSWTNMKLRDEAENLDELCGSYNLDKERLLSRIKSVGFSYDKKRNQFVAFDGSVS